MWQNPAFILLRTDSTRFETSGRSSKNKVNPVKTKNRPALTAKFEEFIRKSMIRETDVNAIMKKADDIKTKKP